MCPIGSLEPGYTKSPALNGFKNQRIVKDVPFQASKPDMRLFPYRQWARTIARVSRCEPESLVAGSGLFGDLVLREAVANHIAEWRGVTVNPHQVIITAGSGDALEICIRTLATSKGNVSLENPCYPPLRNFVESLGLSVEWLKVSEHGAELPSSIGMSSPGLVVLTPSHQYPLGGAMSPGRRIEFLNWADANQSWIIEDDYDSEFRYAGSPIQAMAGFDRSGRTIYVGSFSKVFTNSLRLGYLVVPPSLISSIEQVLQSFGTKASLLPQRPLARFIENGDFYRHLRRMRRVYGDRRKFLLGELRSKLGQISHIRDHQAGMQIVLHLPEEIDDVAIETKAAERGITVLALSKFYAVPPVKKGLLLGFCGFNEKELEQNLGILTSIMV